VGCGVLEAADLLVLAREIGDRVPDEEGEAERRRYLDRGEVADRQPERCRAGLRLELRDHRRREIDPVHGDPAPAERQGDPAGADAELERPAVTGQPGQEFDGGADHGRIEPVR
jgi:hypothetical protein